MTVQRAAKVTAHRVLGVRAYAALQTRYWRARVQRLRYPYEFRSEIEAAVSPGDTVLDIGANVGQYAALLSGMVGPTGRVLAFEPEPHTFSMLESIVRGLELSNVEPIRVALADFVGTAPIADVFDADGLPEIGLAHLATSTEPSSGEVRVERLDRLRAELRIDACSFAKIDVEGAELPVLRGAATFLATRRPLLMLELDAALSARYEASPEEAVRFLGALGYQQWKPRPTDWRSGQSVLFLPA